MDKRNPQWLIPMLLALGVAAALAYYWYRSRPATPPVAEPPAVEEEAEPEPQVGPLHPVPEPEPDDSEQPELTPLPSLDESDEYFKLELDGLFGDPIGALLIETDMIERAVATIDNLSREHVSEKIRPTSGLSEPFLADSQGEGNRYRLNSASYERYDELVTLINSADIASLVATYQRYYPLFQASYEELGYPDAYFNDRLVEVIDHLLETPDVADGVELTRPHVLYEYADPALEELSSGQKLLIRMGSENAAKMKATMREFRQVIVNQ